MESKDRLKRPRQEEQSENNNDGGGNNSSDEKPPPPYGSQDYWEERYKRMKESKNNLEDPDPFHAWYFTYEELAPILMPLILGEGVGDSNNGDEEPDDEDEEGDAIPQEQKEVVNGKEEVGRSKNIDKNKQQIRNQNFPSENGEIQAKPVDATTTTEEGDGDFTGQDDDEAEDDDCENDDEYEEVGGGDDGDDDDDEEEEEDDDDDAPIRIGLAKDGPISILEVGCGDVPLGRDLAKGIAELESVAGVQVTKILKRVVCSDYSKCVIQTLNEEKQKNWNLSIPLTYEVVDARKMPYDNESFEMIIEKGTLDAMLSDRDKGIDNCKSIVSECARVLAVGGYFVLVSHLNAHAQKGLQWLDDIVIPGLRMGVRDNSNGYKWNLEVHGNDEDVPSDKDEGADDNDENNNDGDSVEEQSHGPAVYVIQKIPNNNSNSTGTTTEKGTDEPPPIDLRFFSY